MTDDAPIDEHGGWKGVIGALVDGADLTADQARAAMTTILEGLAEPAQIAGFIVALRMKGETVAELDGMVDAMLGAATPLEVPPGTIDIVGTGGSPRRRIRALNVSTMACIVAASAGATVCKHGNIRASSTSGSFDLLNALGVGYDGGPDQVAATVRDLGVGFCFARAFHPAMRHAGPVRAALGVPTVFNVLGPLSHPGRVDRQLIGVGDPRLTDLVAGVLAARGHSHSLVVHGLDSLDELTLSGSTTVREIRDGELLEPIELTPDDVGLTLTASEEMPGGSPEENAAIARDTFAGKPGPARDIVVLNAGAGLYIAGLADSIAAGVATAQQAIDDGSAARRLDDLVAATTSS